MGTPMRYLLQPKLVSPLSPTLRSAQNVANVCKNGSPQLKNYSKARSLAKVLNFEIPSIVKNHSPLRDERQDLNTAYESHIRSGIKLEITDCSAGSLLINTPNKNKLLQEGLCSTNNFKILGKGAFGTVAKGIYKDEEVAVKIVKLRNKSNSLREDNALQFNHENIVKIIDITIRDKMRYGIVIMEYLNNSKHLQSILDDQSVPLNLEIIAKYALDICRGLLHCHERGILHLDLKPSNVLVCANNLCKVCDFGNSVKLGYNHQTNTYQGTAAYAAPELLLGKPPTCKCDVYSLGVLLWQMRYRENPYSDLDAVETIIYKVVKFGCRPNSTDTLQDDYHSIYTNCWATNPGDRPDIPSVINMLSMLPV